MALPLAVIAGAPAYLNGFAAIPLVRSLINLGMPASIRLAFMLLGSVTSILAAIAIFSLAKDCLLYTSPSPRDKRQSRMPSSA